MSELPYMPCHVHDEIASTSHLSNEEMGAFRRLCLALWRKGGFLPDDPRKLARHSRAGKRWGQLAPAIMDMLTVEGGMVSYQPLLNMLDLTRKRRRQAAEKATLRWAVEKSGAAGANSRFRSQQKGEQEGLLSSRKPLKYNDTADAAAYLRHQPQASNHNQNHLEEDSIRSGAVAAASITRLSDGRKDADPLFGPGSDLLVSRANMKADDARRRIARWLAAIDDPELLAALLAQAEQDNLTGPAFLNVVDQRVQAIERERTKGLPLPFPPAVIK